MVELLTGLEGRWCLIQCVSSTRKGTVANPTCQRFEPPMLAPCPTPPSGSLESEKNFTCSVDESSKPWIPDCGHQSVLRNMHASDGRSNKVENTCLWPAVGGHHGTRMTQGLDYVAAWSPIRSLAQHRGLVPPRLIP